MDSPLSLRSTPAPSALALTTEQLQKAVLNPHKYPKIIVDQILSQGSLIANENEEIKMSNKQVEHLLGYSKKELIDKKVGSLFVETLAVPDFYAYCMEHLAKDSQKPVLFLRGLHKEAHIIPLKVRVDKVALKGGATLLSLLLKKTNSTLAKKQMANFYHDLKGCAFNLKMIGDSLQHSLPKLGYDPVLIKDLVYNADFLAQLLEDALEFEQLEQHQLKLKAENFSLLSLIHLLQAQTKFLAQLKKISLSLPSLAKDLFFIGDSMHLDRILYNLLNNAIKFTPTHGTVSLSLEILEETDKEMTLCFSVCDSGKGIPKDQQQRIFEPYEQLATSDPIGQSGFGLGLAICKMLTELFHGSLAVKNNVDRGTTFSLTLNLPKGKKVSEITLPPVNPQLFFSDRTIRALVIDDVKTSRLFVQRTLLNLGCSCDIAGTREEFWSKLTTGTYEVIFTDFHMPEMTGTELAAELRLKEYKQPIVICSATKVTPAELIALPNTHSILKTAKPKEYYQLIENLFSSQS